MTHHVAQLIRRGAARQRLCCPRREDGQGLVEYGLIIGAIAVVVAAAVGGFGTALLNLYSTFPGPF